MINVAEDLLRFHIQQSLMTNSYTQRSILTEHVCLNKHLYTAYKAAYNYANIMHTYHILEYSHHYIHPGTQILWLYTIL